MRELWRWQLMAALAGVALLGLGWALDNYYLVAAGALLVCGLVALLTVPRPPREPDRNGGDRP